MARKTTTSYEVKRRWDKAHYTKYRFLVPKELGKAFKERCVKLDISQASVVRTIMEEYIKENS